MAISRPSRQHELADLRPSTRFDPPHNRRTPFVRSLRRDRALPVARRSSDAPVRALSATAAPTASLGLSTRPPSGAGAGASPTGATRQRRCPPHPPPASPVQATLRRRTTRCLPPPATGMPSMQPPDASSSARAMPDRAARRPPPDTPIPQRLTPASRRPSPQRGRPPSREASRRRALPQRPWSPHCACARLPPTVWNVDPTDRELVRTRSQCPCNDGALTRPDLPFLTAQTRLVSALSPGPRRCRP